MPPHCVRITLYDNFNLNGFVNMRLSKCPLTIAFAIVVFKCQGTVLLRPDRYHYIVDICINPPLVGFQVFGKVIGYILING